MKGWPDDTLEKCPLDISAGQTLPPETWFCGVPVFLGICFSALWQHHPSGIESNMHKTFPASCCGLKIATFWKSASKWGDPDQVCNVGMPFQNLWSESAQLAQCAGQSLVAFPHHCVGSATLCASKMLSQPGGHRPLLNKICVFPACNEILARVHNWCPNSRCNCGPLRL